MASPARPDAHRLSADEGQPPQTNIDLLVRDRKGRPVANLQRADLAITDGGKPVQLTSLRMVQGTDAGSRLVTFVFGQMSAGAAKNARGVALSILKTLPDHGYTYAVFGVDGRLRLFASFTPNRDDVQAAIDAVTEVQPAVWQQSCAAQEKQLVALAGGSSGASSAGEAGAGEAGAGETGAGEVGTARTRALSLLAALQQSERLVNDRHDLPDLAGLTALGTAEQKLVGRKAILYFGQSTQVDVNTLDQFHASIQAAERGGVSIYAVDMNALDDGASQAMVASMSMGNVMSSANQAHASAPSGPSSGFHSLLGPVGTRAVSDTINNIEVENMEGKESAFGQLALRTGGRYTGYNNGVKKFAQQLASDLDHFYQASYLSAARSPDGSFRAVTVKSIRSGLVIHAPSGYYALPPDQQPPTSMLDASLAGVFEHPDHAGDLACRAAALHFGQTTEGGIIAFVIEVPIQSLDVREDPNSDLYAYHVEVAARIEMPDGKIVREFSEAFHHRGRLDALEADRTGAVSFERHAVLSAGEYKLVTALVDVNSGKTGIHTEPFQVSASSGRLSDLVLVRRTERASATDEIERNPLRYGAAEIVPDLSGTLAPGTPTATIFFSAQPVPGNVSAATLSSAKDGRQFGQWTLDAMPSSRITAKSEAAPRGTSASPYMSTLTLKTLPPGRYEVSASRKQDNITEVRHLVFEKTADVNATGSEPASAVPPAEVSAPADASRMLFAEHAPSPEAKAQWLASARKRALGYKSKLPNFMCLESIDRMTDRSGKGRWQHRDTISEL